MDADGQDEPEEIPGLLAALDGGLDLVTGRRVQRNDRFVKRHDLAALQRASPPRSPACRGTTSTAASRPCSREVVATSLELYGELHRYIPVLADWSGFRSARSTWSSTRPAAWQTKFGRARFWRGFLDLMTVKFLTTYTARRSTSSAGSGWCSA